MTLGQISTGNLKLRRLGKVWTKFLPNLLPSWKPLTGALACALGAVAMELARPWPLKLVVDMILIPQAVPEFPRLAVLPSHLLLAGICVGLLVISMLWGLFSYGQQLLTAYAGQSVVFALRRQAHAHLQRLSLNFHRKSQKGDLLMRLTGDINVLRDLLVNGLVQAVGSVLLLTAMLAFLLATDWRLGIVVLALIPILALTTFRFSGQIRKAAQKQRRREGRIAASISETLQGIDVIQAFGRERVQDKRFERSNKRGLKAGMKVTRLEASMQKTVEVLLAAGTAAVFWYGVTRVQGGHLSTGDLLLFVSYTRASFKPLRRLARVSSRSAKAVVCAGRVRELIKESPEITNRSDAKTIHKALRGPIEFRRVSFEYPDSEDTLRRVNFTIAPGSFTGIVGPSGSGKSTILALLLRLYDPHSGSIRIGGKDTRRYLLESLRDQFGVVLQQPFLFGGTIRENILFARPDADPESVEKAAKWAGVSDFLDPELGLDQELAEAGASLSAGQRQRISIARAFLKEPSILLLDEPTTGLDAANEIKVLAALHRLMTRRTTVMVAHKLATVATADQILVVRKGRVIEAGSHRELLALGGWYARTWSAQAEEYPDTNVVPLSAGRRALA